MYTVLYVWFQDLDYLSSDHGVRHLQIFSSVLLQYTTVQCMNNKSMIALNCVLRLNMFATFHKSQISIVLAWRECISVISCSVNSYCRQSFLFLIHFPDTVSYSTWLTWHEPCLLQLWVMKSYNKKVSKWQVLQVVRDISRVLVVTLPIPCVAHFWGVYNV